jgi:hypothetical protein
MGRRGAPAGARALGARRDAPDHLAVRPVLDRTRDRGHGRVELRTLKAVTVHRFGSPHAAQVLQVTARPAISTATPGGSRP